MDVIKYLSALTALLFFVGCGDEDPPAENTTFTKPDSGSECDQQRIPKEYLVQWKNGQQSVVPAENDDVFIKKFLKENSGNVLLAEPHFSIRVAPANGSASDSFGGDLNWGSRSISAPDVWADGFLGEDIIVAVIDSGVDTSHPELQAVFAINEDEEVNGIDDDGNGLVDDRTGYDFVNNSGDVVDRTGHGTHVTGIIAASHSEGSVKGIAPAAKILPLSFIAEGGLGSVNGAIRAISYAASRGAKVINASWGGSQCSVLLREAINNLKIENVLFVSAAGNSGQNLDNTPEYPASFPLNNVLTVGASTFDHFTAGFSNYGGQVDVVAPGAFILSTYPKKFETPDRNGKKDGIQDLDGTSMSTPFVVGAAALLWSAKPQATYQEIVQSLLDTVDSGPFPVASRGQINVKRALDQLLSTD